ncbi:hypothetical protein QBC39DRAFT_341829 [Podospora conica]|nr:hypothetical protein QBC39DRAFT_341829 [Schizothecium conicum]
MSIVGKKAHAPGLPLRPEPNRARGRAPAGGLDPSHAKAPSCTRKRFPCPPPASEVESCQLNATRGRGPFRHLVPSLTQTHCVRFPLTSFSHACPEYLINHHLCHSLPLLLPLRRLSSPLILLETPRVSDLPLCPANCILSIPDPYILAHHRVVAPTTHGHQSSIINHQLTVPSPIDPARFHLTCLGQQGLPRLASPPTSAARVFGFTTDSVTPSLDPRPSRRPFLGRHDSRLTTHGTPSTVHAPAAASVRVLTSPGSAHPSVSSSNPAVPIRDLPHVKLATALVAMIASLILSSSRNSSIRAY